MPRISVPSTAIPSWNVRPEKYLETVFEFADLYLHDDAALLLFHPNDRNVLLEVEDLAETYNFRLQYDWWAMNDLPLALPRNPSSTVYFIFSHYLFIPVSVILYVLIYSYLVFVVYTILGSIICTRWSNPISISLPRGHRSAWHLLQRGNVWHSAYAQYCTMARASREEFWVCEVLHWGIITGWRYYTRLECVNW